MDIFVLTESASNRVRRFGLFALLVGICLFLLAPGYTSALNPGAGIERRGLILAMNRPLDTEAEQLFKGVVAQSVRGGLERRKLGVIVTTAPASTTASFTNPANFLDSAVTDEVDFILLTEYASRGNELDIRMAWYDPQSGEITEEVIRRGRKDLVLDKIIREALSELLNAVESSLDTLEPKVIASSDAVVFSNADFNPGGGTNSSDSMGALLRPVAPENEGALP
ncbi:MAG: hypothetical protein JSV89_12785, partial [Spirochaetaceae bacterium]